MIATRRAVATLCGMTLALGAALTSAEANDVEIAPVRATTNDGSLGTGVGDAMAYSVTVQPDGSRAVLGTTGGNSFRVLGYAPNPNNPQGFSAAGVLFGNKTGLASALGLFRDGTGRIWAADGINRTVSAFPPGAGLGSNDVAPVLTIAGPNTGLVKPTDVTVSRSGAVVVTDQDAGTVSIFPGGTGGNIEPRAVLTSGVLFPNGVATDSAGRIYVASSGVDTILVFAADAATGDAPIRVIGGANTFLHTPRKLALDSSDNLYVTNYTSGASDPVTNTSVTVYAPGANGDVAPIKRLNGVATKLVSPTGLALDADRRIYVANQVLPNAGSTLVSFAPLVPLTKPSAARSVAVSGSSTSTTRKITWSAPTSTGGTPITKYLVVVKKGSKVTYNKTTTSRSYTVRKSTLSNGTNTVTITAVNKVGNAPAATKTFTVKK